MNQKEIVDLFSKASASVADLPPNLQEKAFELAVAIMIGEPAAGARVLGSPPGGVMPPSRPALRELAPGEPDLVDLLKVCKRNPDRYIAFMQELENKGEPATSASLLQCFKTYKQDIPKLPSRDIDELVAKNWVDRDKTTFPHVFSLKQKGRARLTELAALAAAGGA